MTLQLTQPLKGKRNSHVRWADEPNGDLIIFVPGLIGNAINTWMHFPTLIGRELTRNTDIVFFGHNGGRSQIQAIVGMLDKCVAQLWEHPASFQPFPQTRSNEFKYQRIFLCGHSLGGVVVRDVAASAAEQNEPWSKSILLGLFAPAHKGVSASILFAEKFAKAATIMGQWPLSAFQFFYPVIHDLRPNSGYLTGLEQRTITLANSTEHSKNLIARFVVFGELDNIVEQDRFAADPYPPIIIENKDHVTVCKPIPLLFEEPFEILTEAIA